MHDENTLSLPDSVILPFESHFHAITPYFKHMSILNVAQSENKGEPVYELKEMVELRFAGDRNYAPICEVSEMWRNVKGRVITYAERFSDQYRAFIMGENQVAGGTALEVLKRYGMTPAQISMCNALKVYSVEAILEMRNVNALGMATNAIREMAKRWQEEQTTRQHTKTVDDIETLKAELARLQALIPAEQTAPEQIDVLVKASDDEIGAMDEDALRKFIETKTGEKPHHRLSVDSLRNAARELAA